MVSSNNAINNTVGASISGVTNTLTVTNASDTASSAARETITVGGASAGDPTLNFNVSGVTNWEMGIDNSSSDSLKISQGTALGTNDTWIMTTSGERTMPLQPCVAAYRNAVASSVTGDSTGYTVIFDVERSDQNADYDTSTGIFTAPVAGNYLITTNVAYNGLTSAHTGAFIIIATSNGDFWTPSYNPYAIRSIFTTQQSMVSCVINQLDAMDTVHIIFVVYNGSKVVSVLGAAVYNEYSSLGIFLLA